MRRTSETKPRLRIICHSPQMDDRERPRWLVADAEQIVPPCAHDGEGPSTACGTDVGRVRIPAADNFNAPSCGTDGGRDAVLGAALQHDVAYGPSRDVARGPSTARDTVAAPPTRPVPDLPWTARVVWDTDNRTDFGHNSVCRAACRAGELQQFTPPPPGRPLRNIPIPRATRLRLRPTAGLRIS